MLARRPTALFPAALLLLSVTPGLAQEDPRRTSLDSLLSIPVHAAARYAQARSDAPAAVTVITADEIAAFGYRTLDQVLARAAGFYTSYDRNYTYVGVRGFSRPTDYNSRILLLLNGQPMNENVYGAAPIGDELGFDMSLLERVEIVRGPVSSLYGTSAMFAVINLITIEPDRNGAYAAAEAGSHGYVLGSARGHLADGNRTLLASAQVTRSDGADLFYPEYAGGPTQGVALDLDWSRQANAFVAGRWGNLRAQARASKREKGIPTGAWGTDFGVRGTETTDAWLQSGVQYEKMLGAMTLQITATADQYQYRGRYPTDGIPLHDASDMRRFGGSAQTTWDITAGNRLVAGLTYTRTSRADYRAQYGNDPQTVTDLPYSARGVYFQDELHLNRWATLILGLRADDETHTDVHITPRASAILRPRPGSTIKLLYGTAFRSPSAYERFYNEDLVVLNDVEPERIRTLELVGEEELGESGVVRLSLFHDVVDDLIDPIEDDAGYRFANFGSVRTQGVEGEFTWGIGPWLVNGSGILQQAVDRATDEELSNAPTAIAHIGVNGVVRSGLSLAVQAHAETGRPTVRGGRTDGFMVTDVGIRYGAGRSFTAGLFVDNALGQQYAHPGGLEHEQDAIGQNGRRVRVHVQLNR